MGKNQHVAPHPKGWKVQGEGNVRATKVTHTQKEAINIGKGIAIKQQGELTIHGRDGRIKEKNSYGNDPCPPKDKG